jgi:hypothetical protein
VRTVPDAGGTEETRPSGWRTGILRVALFNAVALGTRFYWILPGGAAVKYVKADDAHAVPSTGGAPRDFAPDEHVLVSWAASPA